METENAINGKQKVSVGKETLAVFATMRVNVEIFRARHLPLQKTQTNNDRKNSSEDTPPRGKKSIQEKRAPEAKGKALEPQTASPWWTSTYAGEERDDTVIKTTAGEHTLPFCGQMFRFWDYIFNREGKMHDSLEVKMQSANKSLVEGRDDFQE